ncbi:28S ribosomal protein S22 [Tropilaelaps mercedesae]|uniref:28S ribosomal protein S22 n=1 Tax=Tropilaelaps mercedesae TaxID=418985 RepID=A0A1V9X830_9ACAR|nr:28S ribosomal protein S22 [Tropilaelaps mercedesae]
MAGFSLRLGTLRPLLLSFESSTRNICIVQSAGSATTSQIPNKIDETYVEFSKVDIETLFLSKRTQVLLQQLTCTNIKRVFVPRKKEHTPPQYELLTDEQYQKEVKKAICKAKKLTQMPPVLRMRKPCERVLQKDPELQGLNTSKFIFTDISFGYDETMRPIVVRETDGTLRTASWGERERMMQIYFTNPHREMETPAMFKEPYLSNILSSEKYIFVLDRACIQFEPNSEEYLGVTQRVFEHLKGTLKFDMLRSTRHFGPMCFYYAVTQQCDPLMLEMLTCGRLQSASMLVKLLHEIHPDLKSVKEVHENGTPEEYVEAYIKWESQKKPALGLALQSCRELKKAEHSETELT